MRGNQEVSGMEMLEARDRRSAYQQLLLSGGSCLISFTMNIPGKIKVSRLISYCFREGAYLIDKQLQRGHAIVLQREIFERKTGYEGFWLLDADPYAVKGHMVQIEELCEIGRLFDIDVLLPGMKSLSRVELGYSQRSCLICGRPAHECARSQSHGHTELFDEIQRMMKAFNDKKRARFVAEAACKSMLYEVSTTPKPGLVDRFDNGSHEDMDFFSFLNSTAALTPEFSNFYFLGLKNGNCTPRQLFGLSRYPGMCAEDVMRDATGGCNTHKGLIFSLGVICAALGWHDANGKEVSPGDLLIFCGEMVREQLSEELDILSKNTARTGGERMYLALKDAGIRTEAANGYPTVRNHGLPALHKYLEMGLSYNDAGVYTLMEIMAFAQDSNIFARCGAEMQSEISTRTQALLKRSFPADYSAIERLNEYFIKQHISPGGSADLLAVTLFLHFLFSKQH